MSLFDGEPLTIEQVRANLQIEGGTIRTFSSRGPGDPVIRTSRHKPWWQLIGKGPEDKTCKECEHLRRQHYHTKVYFKCGRQLITRGPGTDIRCKDEACRLFKEEES